MTAGPPSPLASVHGAPASREAKLWADTAGTQFLVSLFILAVAGLVVIEEVKSSIGLTYALAPFALIGYLSTRWAVAARWAMGTIDSPNLLDPSNRGWFDTGLGFAIICGGGAGLGVTFAEAPNTPILAVPAIVTILAGAGLFVHGVNLAVASEPKSDF